MTVVYLDSDSFRRLIGPIEDILKRNAAKYEKYLKKWYLIIYIYFKKLQRFHIFYKFLSNKYINQCLLLY